MLCLRRRITVHDKLQPKKFEKIGNKKNRYCFFKLEKSVTRLILGTETNERGDKVDWIFSNFFINHLVFYIKKVLQTLKIGMGKTVYYFET